MLTFTEGLVGVSHSEVLLFPYWDEYDDNSPLFQTKPLRLGHTAEFILCGPLRLTLRPSSSSSFFSCCGISWNIGEKKSDVHGLQRHIRGDSDWGAVKQEFSLQQIFWDTGLERWQPSPKVSVHWQDKDFSSAQSFHSKSP